MTDESSRKTQPSRRPTLLMLGLVYCVFWSQFAWVKATNFEGVDEWVVLDLTWRGIVEVPHANRPLGLLWNLFPALVYPHSLEVAYLFYTHYLAATGCLVTLLCLRLLPRQPLLAFMAGVFSVVWVPADSLRLATYYSMAYAGVSFGALLSMLLLVESWRRGSVWLLGLSIGLAVVAARVYEGVLPLLLFAPLLLLAVRPNAPRRLRVWVVPWLGILLVIAGSLGWALLSPAESLYQTALVGVDLNPLRVLYRLLLQFSYHLVPLVSSPSKELAVVAVPAALGVFGLAYALLVRRGVTSFPGEPSTRVLVLVLLGGLAAAALGYGALVLSPRMWLPLRTQFIAAPGIGVALAALVGLATRRLPGRWRTVAPAVLAGWVVAVGAGRTLAMQQHWDRMSYHAPQNRLLGDLTRLVPDLEPHTLVALIDPSRIFRAGFTFRYAMDYMYEGRAIGYAFDAWDPFHTVSFERTGVRSEPLPAIRSISRPTFHRYEEIVVVYYDQAGLIFLDQWPAGVLPPLPEGARYDPASRVVTDGAAPPARAILRRSR